jgi:hypothetical protein
MVYELIENDTLGIILRFFLVDILRIAHTNPITTCRALSDQKCRRVGSAQWKAQFIGQERAQNNFQTHSATHVLPVLTFPLSLGFAAGNLE